MSDNTDQIRLPFRRHLEWMLLEGREIREIKRFYHNIQFPELKEEHFDEAQDKVDSIVLPPITKRNLAKKICTAQDRAIFKKYGYEEIYLRSINHQHMKAQWDMVGQMLNHPVMRVAVDACLINGMPADELIEILPVQFQIKLDMGAIDLYKKYFFDHESMDRSDWRGYLKLLRNDSYTYHRIYAALTKSREEVLFMVNLPTKSKFASFLNNVLATADYKFRYYAKHNSPEADAAADKWAKIGFKAGELHEKFSGSDMTDFAKLVQTEFTYIDTPMETIKPEMLSGVKPAALQAPESKPVNAPPPPPVNTPSQTNDPDNI